MRILRGLLPLGARGTKKNEPGARPGSRSLRGGAAAVTLPESLHPAGGVHQLLLPREKRMTDGTDLDVNIRQRRAGLEGIPARAVHRRLLIRGMNVRLHSEPPVAEVPDGTPGQTKISDRSY